MNDQKTLGGTLRSLRKSNGLSRTAVAHRMGVTEVQVGRWERDENEPHPTNLAKLAEILGTTMESLGFHPHSMSVNVPEWAKKLHQEQMNAHHEQMRKLENIEDQLRIMRAIG